MSAQKSNQQSIVVTAVESNTAVGLTMEQSSAAIRAGISGFREHPPYIPIIREFDIGDDPVQVASNGYIGRSDWARLFDLIIEPLTTLVEESRLTRPDMAEGAFYFALPFEDEVIQKCNLRRHFLAQASEHLALPETKEFLGVQMGSTGVYALIERAMSKMQSGEIKFCIIAAVDSYLLDDRLHLYDQQWRIKTDRNPAGFIPGEAGAVLLLETEEFARDRKAAALVRIDGVRSGQENNSILGEKTSSGTGLTDAIRSLADVPNKDQAWQWVLSDLNGERYKAFEWGLVQTRLNKLIANDHHLSHIADVVGDIGAATAAVQVGYVSKAFERGFAPASTALLFAGSDEGKRYAMALSKMH